jgi:hypothetical protein
VCVRERDRERREGHTQQGVLIMACCLMRRKKNLPESADPALLQANRELVTAAADNFSLRSGTSETAADQMKNGCK